MGGGGSENLVNFFPQKLLLLELGQHHISEQFSASQACS